MPGDIKLSYGTPQGPFFTSFTTVPASQTFESGYSSNFVAASSEQYIDWMISAQFVSAGTNRQAGEIRTYVYTALLGDDVWPDLFSVGTPGTSSNATVRDTEQRDSGMVLLKTLYADDGASDVYSFAGVSLLNAIGGTSVPFCFAFFVTTNIATGTNLAFGTGSAFYAQPVLAQYT
jgi:hypothetical protein